jgi:signal peptidase I
MTLDSASQPAIPRPTGQVSTFRRWAGIVVCVALFLVVVAFFSGKYQTFRVQAKSMEPAILDSDYILVDARKPFSPKRGQVVALIQPNDANEWLCKRVIALPLDRVELRRDGNVYVNGEQEGTAGGNFGTHFRALPRVWKLGESEYFVLGDNRAVSLDSRQFGPVPVEDFIGRVVCVYWPRERMRWIHENPESESK